ncbi:hypothetical protein BGZ46_008379 [Entomortierella lignicola]|nr:hypothetical protein BGZ46_008379 [Entomortierella lignicola]
MDTNQTTTIAPDETTIRPATPLTIKTNLGKDFAIDMDVEPSDSNSMGPGGMSPALYVVPPAPSHCNDSSRRLSNAASFDTSSMGIMADVCLDSSAITAQSPVEHPTATSTSSPHGTNAALSAAMFKTDRSVPMPTSSTKAVQFVLESPHAIEMQCFSNNPTTPVDPTAAIPADDATAWEEATATKERRESWQSAFFTGFLAIPPSLAGRPPLSPETAEYAKRVIENGPVPLLWPKSSDIENQGSGSSVHRTRSTATTASTKGADSEEPSSNSDSNSNSSSSNWFNWNFWSSSSQNTMPAGEQGVMAH